MCGINGFTFADNDLIARMNARVEHRGPDDHGSFVEDNISLGHQRLSIIDLSPAGHQPMLSDDGNVVLVFNGEIYNYQDIRADLQKKGFSFHSKSDSEVIIQAYRAYGTDCLKYFNGIFAFAIWDKKIKRLFVARDRIGVKPLYYYHGPVGASGQQLIFSSEIKAILEHQVKKKINMDALNIYLRMLYVPAPLTMFEGVKKLLPGHFLTFEQKQQLTVTKYWSPVEKPPIGHDEAVSNIRSLTGDAVRLQLISDRPVGVFLSGGIDSTVITGLAKKYSGGHVNTFSVKYDIGSEKFNTDASLAKKTSVYFGTNHHEVEVTGADCLKYLDSVAYHMDEPVANATQIATYVLSQFTKPYATVVLGGDGGDELFGGYERYRLSRYITAFQMLPAPLRSLAFAAGPVLQQIGFDKDKFSLAPGVDRYLGFMSQKEMTIARVLRQGVNNTAATRSAYERYFLPPVHGDAEQQLMWADVQSWLPDESLLRSDKMSMAFGIEQRVPLLDHRLVELSLQIPTSLKIRGKNKKAIFKESMQEFLPDFVVNQPKRGWFSPTSEWMRGALAPQVKEVLSAEYNPMMKEVFDFPALQEMYARHVDRREYQMNLLWAVVMFQLWYRQFFGSK